MQWAVLHRTPGRVLPISDATVVQLTHALLLAAECVRQGDAQNRPGSDDRQLPRFVTRIVAKDPMSLAVLLLHAPPHAGPCVNEDEPELALGRLILQQFQDFLTGGQERLPLQLTSAPRNSCLVEERRRIIRNVREVFLVQQLARRWARLNERKVLGLIPFAAVATVQRLFFSEEPVDFAARLAHLLGNEHHSRLGTAFEAVRFFDRFVERLDEVALEVLLFPPQTAPEWSLAKEKLDIKDLPQIEKLFSAESHPPDTADHIPLDEGWSRAAQMGFRLANRWRRRVPACRQFWETATLVTKWASTLHGQFSETLEKAKLDAMAEFAAGAGHEINNPLAIISGHAQLLLRQVTHPEWQRMLATIVVQAQRAHEMIADARLFARPPKPVFTPVNYVELLQTIVEEYAPQAASRQIRLELTTRPEGLAIFEGEADRSQILTALGAIVKNALEAVPENGIVSLGIHAEANHVEISIADNGPGISPEIRRHLFDPFFSGRQAGRGLGMGLSKAWRIVTLHGGRIDVDSSPGKETVFRISLPRYPAAHTE